MAQLTHPPPQINQPNKINQQSAHAFVPSAKLVQPAAAAVGRKAATTMKLDLPSIAAGLAPAVLASPAFAAGTPPCIRITC